MHAFVLHLLTTIISMFKHCVHADLNFLKIYYSFKTTGLYQIMLNLEKKVELYDEMCRI